MAELPALDHFVGAGKGGADCEGRRQGGISSRLEAPP
jgi:hypothetical protein